MKKKESLYKAPLWTRFVALFWRKTDVDAVVVRGKKRVPIVIRTAEIPFSDKIVILEIVESDDVTMYIPEMPAGNA